MDTRKIQSVGGGTYTVSLPKDWAQSRGLGAGDVVNLHTHIDGLLVVQPRDVAGELPERTAVRVADDDSASIKPTLRAAYAAGATEVALRAPTGFNAEQRRAVEETARNLTGASVVEEADTAITAQIPLDPEEVSVRQSVRQLKFVALSMHRDAAAVLTDGAPPERLYDRDEQADRLYALIERSFVRGLARLDEVDALGLTRSELFELWLTARELERVADHAERLATVAAGVEGISEGAGRDQIEAATRTARQIVSDAVGVVVGDRGVETAREVLVERDRFRENLRTVDLGSVDPSCAARRSLVLESVRRTAEHGGNVAELALRSAIRRGELSESEREPDDADRKGYAPAGDGDASP